MKTIKLTLFILVFTIFSCSVDENDEDVKSDNKKVDLVTNNLSSSWKTYAYSEFFRGGFTKNVGKSNTRFIKMNRQPLLYDVLENEFNDNLYISSKTQWNQPGNPSPVKSFIETFILQKDTLYGGTDEYFSNLGSKYKVRYNKYYVKAEEFKHLLNSVEFNNLKRSNQGKGAKFDKNYIEKKSVKYASLHVSSNNVFADFGSLKFKQKYIRLDEFYFKIGKGLTYGNYYNITSKFHDFCSFEGANVVALGVNFSGYYSPNQSSDNIISLSKTQIVLKNLQSDAVRLLDVVNHNQQNEFLKNFKLLSMNQNGLVYISEDRTNHRVSYFTPESTSLKDVYSFSTTEKMIVGSFFNDGKNFYLTLVNESIPLKIKVIKFTEKGDATDLGEVTINNINSPLDLSCEVYKGEVFIAYQDNQTGFPCVKKLNDNFLTPIGGLAGKPFTKSKTPIHLISRAGKMYAFINNDLNDIYKPPCCPSGYIMEVLLFQE